MKPVKARAYDNSSRAAQARRTRQRVLDAAHGLLVERGYAATTLGAVAERAGISVDTVYKAFGNKAALTKAVYDVVLAGDDEPVPMVERPEYAALAAEDVPQRAAARYAAIARGVGERLGPLLTVLLGSRQLDADLEAFSRTIEAERLAGSAVFVQLLAERSMLRPGLDLDEARDVVWLLNSPEVYDLLVMRRGWSPDAYERWMAGALADALLVPEPG